jgi:hypothetical protein
MGMAEFIRFRLTSAKVGVIMALGALIGGVADRAGAATGGSGGTPPPLLNLHGITGNVKNAFLKVEAKIETLSGQVATLQKKVRTDYYTKETITKLYLKDETANTEFLKIDNANAQFLKIDNANAEFLKKADTAANSAELGGQPASAFEQGNGNVATGAVTVPQGDNSPHQLLAGPGSNGSIIVVCKSTPGGGVAVNIHNGTTSDLPAVQDINGGAPTAITIPASSGMLLTTIANTQQFHLQTFPASGFNEVLTLTLSGEVTANGTSIVGQMLSGGG